MDFKKIFRESEISGKAGTASECKSSYGYKAFRKNKVSCKIGTAFECIGSDIRNSLFQYKGGEIFFIFHPRSIGITVILHGSGSGNGENAVIIESPAEIHSVSFRTAIARSNIKTVRFGIIAVPFSVGDFPGGVIFRIIDGKVGSESKGLIGIKARCIAFEINGGKGGIHKGNFTDIFHVFADFCCDDFCCHKGCVFDGSDSASDFKLGEAGICKGASAEGFDIIMENQLSAEALAGIERGNSDFFDIFAKGKAAEGTAASEGVIFDSGYAFRNHKFAGKAFAAVKSIFSNNYGAFGNSDIAGFSVRAGDELFAFGGKEHSVFKNISAVSFGKGKGFCRNFVEGRGIFYRGFAFDDDSGDAGAVFEGSVIK